MGVNLVYNAVEVLGGLKSSRKRVNFIALLEQEFA
jgi:hypothetical protein